MSKNNTIALSLFRLSFHELNSRSKLKVNEFPFEGGFGGYLQKIMKEAESGVTIVGSSRALISTGTKKTNRAVIGEVKTGRFGFGAEITNVKTAEVHYQKTVDDAEMVPLYFRCETPSSGEVLHLAFQSFNKSALKDAFDKYLSERMERDFPELRYNWHRIATGDVVKTILDNGHVKKARFIKRYIPNDVADAYGSGPLVDGSGEIEFVIKAARGSGLAIVDRVKEFIDSKRSLDSILEFEEFEYDDIKVEVELSGNRRTIPLLNIGGFAPDYDVTDEVEINLWGHPKIESLDKIAQELLSSAKATSSDAE